METVVDEFCRRFVAKIAMSVVLIKIAQQYFCEVEGVLASCLLECQVSVLIWDWASGVLCLVNA